MPAQRPVKHLTRCFHDAFAMPGTHLASAQKSPFLRRSGVGFVTGKALAKGPRPFVAVSGSERPTGLLNCI